MDYFLEKYKPIKQENELFFELAIAFYRNSNFNKSLEILSQINGDETVYPKSELAYLKALIHKNLMRPKEALAGFIDALTDNVDEKLVVACEAGIKELTAESDSEELYLLLENKIKTVVKQATNGSSQEVFERLISQAKESRNISRQKKDDTISQLKQAGAEALKLTDEELYEAALAKIEEALLLMPDDADLMLLKIRVLVEAQLDLDKAVNLFTDEDYGYLNFYPDKEDLLDCMRQVIQNKPWIKDKAENGNTYFFAAFMAHYAGVGEHKVDEWIQKAESLGLKNKKTYPQTGLHILKADIATKRGDTKAAAINYLEAGKCYYWDGNFIAAASHFKKATTTDTGLGEAFRYAADSLFILSYRSYPPYVDGSQLNEAYNAWHQAPQKSVTKTDDAWQYISIARIHESLYLFSNEGFYNDYWYCLLYAECALLHNETSVSFLTYLGRYLRMLGLEYNAGAVLAKAISPGYDADTNLQEEIAMAQLNIGEFDKAQDWLDAINQKNAANNSPSPYYYKSWQGYLYFFRDKDYARSAALYHEVDTQTPGDLFVLQMKMNSYASLGDLPTAITTAREIIAMDDSSRYPRDAYSFAWAYFVNGETDIAINRLLEFQKAAGPGGEQSYSLAQFYLSTGKLAEAGELFSYFITWCINTKMLQELADSVKTILFHVWQNSTARGIDEKQFKEVSADWQQQLADKIAYLKTIAVTPAFELENKVNELKNAGSAVCNTALAMASLRVYRGEANFAGAKDIYAGLINSASFSEAQTALENGEKQLLTKPGQLIQAADYIGALQILEASSFLTLLANVLKEALLSVASFGNGDLEDAKKSIRNLLPLIAGNTQLQQQCWAILSKDAYHKTLTWRYGAELYSQVMSFASTNQGLSVPVFLDDFWQPLLNPDMNFTPLVVPVAVELSLNLVPENATSPDWYVIKDLLPAMKKRIFDKYGVVIPQVNIRTNEIDLSYNNFRFMLNEVPLNTMWVESGLNFMSEDWPIPAGYEGTTTSINPFTGKQGYWVSDSAATSLRENGMVLWDTHEFIIRSLEALLCNYLDMFVDHGFCKEWLQGFAADMEIKDQEEMGEVAKRIIKDETSFLVFEKVLKNLVREKMPVTNKKGILLHFEKAITTDPRPDVCDIVKMIRIGLKAELPVNTTTYPLYLDLPIETEKLLKEELVIERGASFLAMLPENCQQALADIRDIVGSDPLPGSTVLVTNDTDLRYHLRKLTELEFPSLVVASEEECVNRK
ncbi:MAG: FHIPEP family type III secretion protein [Bacteroidota bacterium]